MNKLASLACAHCWLRRLRILIACTALTIVLLCALVVVNAARAPNPLIQPPSYASESPDVTQARVKALEEWRGEMMVQHLDTRLTIIETTLHIQETNRTLLWTVLGAAVLNFIGTAALGLLSRRSRDSNARAGRGR